MLKLARNPDRTPVKITNYLPPELNEALKDYAAPYQEAFGAKGPVAELVPAMRASFIEGDGEFNRMRQAHGQSRTR